MHAAAAAAIDSAGARRRILTYMPWPEAIEEEPSRFWCLPTLSIPKPAFPLLRTAGGGLVAKVWPRVPCSGPVETENVPATWHCTVRVTLPGAGQPRHWQLPGQLSLPRGRSATGPRWAISRAGTERALLSRAAAPACQQVQSSHWAVRRAATSTRRAWAAGCALGHVQGW